MYSSSSCFNFKAALPVCFPFHFYFHGKKFAFRADQHKQQGSTISRTLILCCQPRQPIDSSSSSSSDDSDNVKMTTKDRSDEKLSSSSSSSSSDDNDNVKMTTKDSSDEKLSSSSSSSSSFLRSLAVDFGRVGKELTDALSPKQKGKGDWKDLVLMSLSFAVYVYMSQKIVCAYCAYMSSFHSAATW